PGLTRTKVGPPGDEIIGPLEVNYGTSLMLNSDGEIEVNTSTISGAGNIISPNDEIEITGGDNAVFHDVDLVIANGAITDVKLANDAVTTDKIANGAVTGEKIAIDAVTTD